MKKHHSIYCTLLTLLLASAVSGQQTPLFSEYNGNTVLINPAQAGIESDTEIGLSNRGFVNGFDGSPRYLTLAASVPKEYAGFAAAVIRDEIGVTTATQVFGAYAYKIYLSQDTNVPRWHNVNPNILSFGISAGFLQFNQDLVSLGITNDVNFAQNIDASIPTIGAGVLYNERNFYIGAGAPNIVGDLLASEQNIELEVPYYLYGGYKWYVGRTQEIFIKPNALIRWAAGAPAQIDFNVFLNYKSKIEVGAGYRTDSLANFLAGVYLFDNIRINYNYNLALNNTPLGSSQGFSLSYRLGNGYSPRR